MTDAKEQILMLSRNLEQKEKALEHILSTEREVILRNSVVLKSISDRGSVN